MPMLDMPLENLKEYQGTNPKPEDFEEYWNRAIKEMKGTDPQVTMTPSDFQTGYADCYDMYFTGVRNARIYTKLIVPKHRKEKMPAVLLFHGYTDSSRSWYDKLCYAAADENRVGVYGGSQGGGLSIACASLEPRICKTAVQYPFLSDYKRVWDMDLAVDAYAELRTYFRQYDPLHIREKQIFEKLGYLDVHNLAPRIRGEVLQAVSMSDTVCPPSTQFAVYNNIQAKKEVMIYYDYGHEDLPGYCDRVFQFMMELLGEEEK